MATKTYSSPKLKRIPRYTTMKVFTPSLASLKLAAAMTGETMIEMASRLFEAELSRLKKKQAREEQKIKEMEAASV